MRSGGIKEGYEKKGIIVDREVGMRGGG